MSTPNIGLYQPAMTDTWGTIIPGIANDMSTIDSKIGILSASVFNPKDSKYGAKGDGTTDDSAAFVSLFSALNTAGGGRVEIPSGTYVIATMPNFAAISNVQFVGKGSVTLKFTYSGAYAGTNKIFSQMNNIVFDGIAFSAPNAALFAIFNDNANLYNITFQNCTIIDCTPNFLMGALKNIVFERCRFTQSATPPATLQQSIGGVQGNFYVRHCDFNFAFNGASGVLVGVLTNTSVLNANINVWIEDNKFMTDNLTGYTMDAAVDVEPYGTTPIESVHILRNVFYNCRAYMTGAKLIECIGNEFHWTSVGQSQNNAVQLNIYNSSTTKPDAGTIIIEDNEVIQDQNASATYATQILKVLVNVNRLLVRRNRFLMNAHGTGTQNIIEWDGGTIDRFVIEDNEIDATQNPSASNANACVIYASYSNVNHFEINRNRILKQWQHLLALAQGSAATIKVMRLENNDLTDFGCSTGALWTAWLWNNANNTVITNARYRNNIGMNPVGQNWAPGVPASGTAWTNNTGYDLLVVVTGGTVSQIAVLGVNTGMTSGAFLVQAGSTITLTYSVVPTWAMVGL